ncbi:NAD(P)H-dependent oxidoreductase [Rossellomorea marisflavi]|uniref:General stress protein n=2 Tax=Rossellomorea marisflavi TaxID=189381 RepID=A0A0M0GRZ9_9BACI|nr:NAD(P)H-dependent oxidoreductase [Rossellomorea marisflavi]KON92538.1 general stress protein [Rossellomorea marisflavi]MCM2591699.1 NAD(P)H-dependent oxidoreductase [Rossellomorea marisflavi]MDR4937658.1 NAD(P)H-dependent oxidoreductase [Rossellomorea marisflavi]VXB20762.1 nitroreductase (unknown substrate) [Bacillus sp. 349Y]
MNVLVIAAHPRMNESIVNKAWVKRLEEEADVTVHDLYREYPDFQIDVTREQKLVEEHDRIVLQFPFYWYSAPALMKEWIDAVLTYGWAYGSGGTQLHGKELLIATSTGSPAEAYQAGGKNHYAMSELLKPFQATSNLIGTTFLPAFIEHGVRTLDEEGVARSAERLADYIKK